MSHAESPTVSEKRVVAAHVHAYRSVIGALMFLSVEQRSHWLRYDNKMNRARWLHNMTKIVKIKRRTHTHTRGICSQTNKKRNRKETRDYGY